MAHVHSQRCYAEVAHHDGFCEVLPFIGECLTQICQKGDLEREVAIASGRPPAISVFDGLAPAPLSVDDYLVRLCEYGQSSSSTFIACGVLLERALANGGIACNSHSIHRLLLGSFVIAAKLRDDHYFQQSYYGVVGGIATEEVNRIERALLAQLRWDLVVTPSQCEDYLDRVQGNCYDSDGDDAFAHVPRPSVSAHLDASRAWIRGQCDSCGSSDEGGLTEEDTA